MSRPSSPSRRQPTKAPLVLLLGVLLVVAAACPASAATGGATETSWAAPSVGGAAVPGTGPRVVLIVGPAGEATTRYRLQAEAAAQEARRYTDNVTTLYSPNATWPAVRAALQGASIVVYLGHGNGWPSRYSNKLVGSTQNGMGLNPVAGGGDDAHEYFGESVLARSVRLAPGAIVLLNHLCYASGNSEPGLPEGTLDMAEQRVDNFAAGWLQTGARAVVAEGHLGPAYYVRSLLATRRSVETIWQASPMAHGHVLTLGSVRTPGATAYLDPDKEAAGFYRSLVLRGAAGPGGVNVPGVVGGVVTPPIEPSLARGGTRFRAPSLDVAAIAGHDTTLAVQVKVGSGVRLPKGVKLSVRWTPIVSDAAGAGASPRRDPAPSVSPAATASPSAAPSLSAAPSPSAAPSASAAPSPSAPSSLRPALRSRLKPASTVAPEATASPTMGPEVQPTSQPMAPPDIDLVVPEAPDQVVEPKRATVKGDVLRLSLTAPAAPGLYRLVTTIHDADGAPYDAATQALIPTVIVRVTPELSAQYAVVSDLNVPAGTSLDLPVRVLNSGRLSWGGRSALVHVRQVGPAETPWLVARWLSLDGAVSEDIAGRTSAFVDRGENRVLVVTVTVPPAPGEYLLILDLDVPGFGPLAARGVPPAIVRVHAGPPVAPSDASPAG